MPPPAKNSADAPVSPLVEIFYPRETFARNGEGIFLRNGTRRTCIFAFHLCGKIVNNAGVKDFARGSQLGE